jgi:hypothetical protein
LTSQRSDERRSHLTSRQRPPDIILPKRLTGGGGLVTRLVFDPIERFDLRDKPDRLRQVLLTCLTSSDERSLEKRAIHLSAVTPTGLGYARGEALPACPPGTRVPPGAPSAAGGGAYVWRPGSRRATAEADGPHVDSLFEQAPEEEPPELRPAPIEAEGELVEVPLLS